MLQRLEVRKALQATSPCVLQHSACAGAGMPVSSLQPLLEGAGLDCLLSHVLPLLSLHDLGRLASTSQRLRAVVADVQEATWQACAWRSQPHPQHPIHRAASCQAYLRTQHATHTAISSGRTTVTRAPKVHDPVLAPDLSSHAVLGKTCSGGKVLRLFDSATERQTACFQLPQQHYYALPSWDLTGSRIAVLWGSSWCFNPGPLDSTGFCIVNLDAATVSRVDLGLQLPGVSIGFTPGGSVVVSHQRGTETTWSVFACSGTEQHSVLSPFAGRSFGDERLILAPAGTHAALYLRAKNTQCTSFALWQLTEDRARSVSTESAVREVLFSPCSRYALSVGPCTQLWNTQGQLQYSRHFEGWTFHGASWAGDVLALHGRVTGQSQVAVYRLQDLALRLAFVYQLPCTTQHYSEWLDSPQVSPDWQHIALLATTDRSLLWRSDLLVIDMGGHLCTRVTLPADHYHLAWSSDGTAIACDYCSSPVVRFA